MSLATPPLRLCLSTWFRRFVMAVVLLAPSAVWAGELKLGATPLETDDDGKLTASGRKAAVTTLPSEPGEEVWILHLWAKLDGGAPGPLYVEFWGKLPSGKPYQAFSHEHAEYDGEKYVSFPVELDGNVGFNKGRTYTIKVTQFSHSKKSLVLATGQVTLEYTEPEPEPADDGGQGSGGEDEPSRAVSEQDALDTLGGPDDASEGPPPVDPASSKKGCSVAPVQYGLSGVLAFFLLGVGLASRRRR